MYLDKEWRYVCPKTQCVITGILVKRNDYDKKPKFMENSLQNGSKSFEFVSNQPEICEHETNFDPVFVFSWSSQQQNHQKSLKNREKMRPVCKNWPKTQVM